MSLLMDALKRAEKARQEEAAKRAQQEGASDSQELSLHPLEDRPGTPEPPAAPAAPPPESPPSRRPSESSGELEFSLDDDDTPPASPSPASPPASPPPPKTSETTEHLGPFSLVDDDAIAMEDTGEMQPIAREAEEAVKEYFDETNSMAIDIDEIQSELDQDTIAGTQPLTAEELARQTAHSVFDAKAAATRRRGRRVALIILPVFLLLFLGVSGFFLWDDLVRLFVGPPPLVSRQPPPPAVAAAPRPEPAGTDAAATPPAESASTGSAAIATAGTGSEPSESPAAEPSTPEQKLVAAAQAATAEERGAATPSQADEQPIPKPSATEVSKPAPAEAPSPTAEAADARIADLTERALSGSAASAGNMPVAIPSLRISRKSTPDRVHPTLQAAYEAFNQGDNARSQSLYEQVLAGDPKNRDALLGIGAIATRAGDVQTARRVYARLLTLNPGDAVARAALIDSHLEVSPVEGESHIKQLLARDPNRPFLYATLGNLYARQSRWPEAQQAYFDAYRLDDDNADYAFNLAVSLDQIGQSAAALTYYRRALQLAEGGQASFEMQAVLKRIASLGMAESG